MANIDCRWPEPTDEEDRQAWANAHRLAAQLPDDWCVNCALAPPAPVVIQNAAGQEVDRLPLIDFCNYRGLDAYLRLLLFIRWEGGKPPDDVLEWNRIAAPIVGRGADVVLTSRPHGTWHVHQAYRQPSLRPIGAHGLVDPTAPIDKRLEVETALRDAGKPVV